MLQINIKKYLGNFHLHADLNIPNQGVTAIFGLSGSGKSSLINLISGLIQPDEGIISLNNRILVDVQQGKSIPIHQRNIGYVFQDARLFPHYNVKGNLCYGMKNVSRAEFDDIIQLLGIEHLLKRYPFSLSGGEKQRVAIGRSLLSSPELLLMDEPLSALDVPRKRELLHYLENLSKEITIPILYVTHSLDELLCLAERVILLEAGKVKAYERLEVLWNHPVFSPWKEKNEQSSVLTLPIHLHNPSYKLTALSIGNQQLWINAVEAPVNQKVRICIHSSDVSIALIKPIQTSIRNILSGHICYFEFQDNRIDLLLQIDTHQIWASISRWAYNDLKLQVGQSVFVQIKAVSVMM
ncbi:molybdenum ABC transporter ATP-binding protein ModC [Rodentibacter caecimuris]|uniref:Molybdenum ABC transporter ATP-binding protein n=1 Tax=Rodentibacter caecimuris TaxID=1796644 RepID=A0ABX3KYF5_9PAST|nr:molybdenum ABC transporter ATP-binding protein [Rodentibacter heylii]